MALAATRVFPELIQPEEEAEKYGGAVSSGGWLLVEHKGQNAWVSGKYGKLE